MRQIVDESALPAPEVDGMEYRYLRSYLEPRAYINGSTGEVFMRRDGRKWEHPAWKIYRDREGVVSARIGTAVGDARRFAPTDSTDSAQAA